MTSSIMQQGVWKEEAADEPQAWTWLRLLRLEELIEGQRRLSSLGDLALIVESLGLW